MQCSGCGGTLGRDCFNQQECVEITQDMAMRSHEQCQPEDIWQLIETAPQNETVICAEFNAYGRWERYLAFYAPAGTLEKGEDNFSPGDDYEDVYAAEGWYRDTSDEERVNFCKPTRWMPLPKPPTTTA